MAYRPKRAALAQRYRLVALAALAAMGGCLVPPGKLNAQGTADVAAKKKVEQFLRAGDPAKELKASIKFVDLNGDGIPEAIVISTDPQDCGSHGCSTNVLDLRGPAAKDIGDFIAFDLRPLSSRTRGWRDLAITGNRNRNIVRFNGRVYSVAQDSSAAAAPSESSGGAKSSAAEIVSAAKIEASAADSSGPEGVVSAVVKLDSGGEGRPFGSDDFVRRYFTAQFGASWDHAMAQPGDVLDGDPVTGSQALKSVKLQATQITTQTADSAIVVAKLAVMPLGGKVYPQSVAFTVKREGSIWKIDDIAGPVDGSLRGYFKKNFGQ